MATVYRIQPPGLGLNHQSECSNGDLSDGVHVFATLEEIPTALKNWMDDPEQPRQELVIVECADEDLDDNEDYEGLLLLAGCGRIVARRSFNSWDAMRSWFNSSSQ